MPPYTITIPMICFKYTEKQYFEQGKSHVQNLRDQIYPEIMKLGSLDFSRYQTIHGPSCTYVTCIYCGLNVKI